MGEQIMGVDYTPVGGLGVKVTDDMVEKFIASEEFTLNEWKDDPYFCLEELGFIYAETGNSYTGRDQDFYLFIDGDNLAEILENVDDFIGDLANFGIHVTNADIKVVEELCID
jgi:hypothetical protein